MTLAEIIAWLDSRAERCRQVPEWTEGAIAYEQRASFLRAQSQEIARLTERCDAYREDVERLRCEQCNGTGEVSNIDPSVQVETHRSWCPSCSGLGVNTRRLSTNDARALLARAALASPAQEQKDKTT